MRRRLIVAAGEPLGCVVTGYGDMMRGKLEQVYKRSRRICGGYQPTKESKTIGEVFPNFFKDVNEGGSQKMEKSEGWYYPTLLIIIAELGVTIGLLFNILQILKAGWLLWDL